MNLQEEDNSCNQMLQENAVNANFLVCDTELGREEPGNEADARYECSTDWNRSHKVLIL